MVIFQKKGMGVLVNFPSQEILNEILLDDFEIIIKKQKCFLIKK